MRRTKRRKSQKLHFHKFWHSGAQRGSAFGRRPVVSFVLALNKAHVLAPKTAHVLRLSKVDVLALNKAHVLRLNTKLCPALTANTKETTKGRGGRPKAASFGLAVNTGHTFVLRRKTCALLRIKICLGGRKTCAVLRAGHVTLLRHC